MQTTYDRLEALDEELRAVKGDRYETARVKERAKRIIKESKIKIKDCFVPIFVKVKELKPVPAKESKEEAKKKKIDYTDILMFITDFFGIILGGSLVKMGVDISLEAFASTATNASTSLLIGMFITLIGATATAGLGYSAVGSFKELKNPKNEE